MSKELEALERLKNRYDVHYILDLQDKDYDIIEQALHRLEAIDNANPSEALECLEKLNGMEISSMPFSDEYGTQEVDLNDIRKVGSQLNTDFREYINTIKQSLLKAQFLEEEYNNLMEDKDNLESELFKLQEPKHYLKWEDLEFKEERQTIKVRMGNNIYNLFFFKYRYKRCHLFNEEGQLIYDIQEQLFNDLRLERVEE